MAHQAGAYPSFFSMKLLEEYFQSPLDGMLVHRSFTPSIKFAGTQLYTWVERGTMRVKCLAQEHNTMYTARARILTARSRDKCTNHELTACFPHSLYMFYFVTLCLLKPRSRRGLKLSLDEREPLRLRQIYLTYMYLQN